MNALKGKKAAYYTLGCKLNFAETSTIQQQLKAVGVDIAGSSDAPDVCIVNTCSVTEVADSKSRQAISRLRRKHPGALMVVTGCYAQLKPDKVAALEGVDLVTGKERLVNDVISLLNRPTPDPSLVGRGEVSPQVVSTPLPTREGSGVGLGMEARMGLFIPACACGERTRFFLKVQDGCDYFCTYCTIPFARGRSRNGSIASLVRQAEEAAQQGGKEIVLTGVNIGDFGKTTGEKFIDLLKALDKVDGIERYRISSIEPNLLTDDIIRFCAESRAFMPHFHIPLQSGSDEVLHLMHRRYDTKFFAQKIDEVRRHIPDAFIGVDVIVGMRGETDELFAKARNFMASLPVSQYHVFSYSERPGTKALAIPGKVSPQEKHERSRQIQALSDEKLHTHYNIYIGQTRPVLLEHSSKGGTIHGFTDNYIRTEVVGQSHNFTIEQLDNTIVQVRLGEWNEKGDALMGTIVKM